MQSKANETGTRYVSLKMEGEMLHLLYRNNDFGYLSHSNGSVYLYIIGLLDHSNIVPDDSGQ